MGIKHTKNQKMSALTGTKQRDAWSSQARDAGAGLDLTWSKGSGKVSVSEIGTT